jgi:hypothetical protein
MPRGIPLTGQRRKETQAQIQARVKKMKRTLKLKKKAAAAAAESALGDPKDRLGTSPEIRHNGGGPLIGKRHKRGLPDPQHKPLQSRVEECLYHLDRMLEFLEAKYGITALRKMDKGHQHGYRARCALTD